MQKCPFRQCWFIVSAAKWWRRKWLVQTAARPELAVNWRRCTARSRFYRSICTLLSHKHDRTACKEPNVSPVCCGFFDHWTPEPCLGPVDWNSEPQMWLQCGLEAAKTSYVNSTIPKNYITLRIYTFNSYRYRIIFPLSNRIESFYQPNISAFYIQGTIINKPKMKSWPFPLTTRTFLNVL
jgi:hypothetical protein